MARIRFGCSCFVESGGTDKGVWENVHVSNKAQLLLRGQRTDLTSSVKMPQHEQIGCRLHLLVALTR